MLLSATFSLQRNKGNNSSVSDTHLDNNELKQKYSELQLTCLGRLCSDVCSPIVGFNVVLWVILSGFLFDLVLFLLLGLVLASVFLILPLLFSFFSTSIRKITPLESGFVPLEESSRHFNNQFFIVLVIFVIFDLEVVLSICVICLSLNS